jgi:hypothetical protein
MTRRLMRNPAVRAVVILVLLLVAILVVTLLVLMNQQRGHVPRPGSPTTTAGPARPGASPARPVIIVTPPQPASPGRDAPRTTSPSPAPSTSALPAISTTSTTTTAPCNVGVGGVCVTFPL